MSSAATVAMANATTHWPNNRDLVSHIFSVNWRIPMCRDVLVQRYGFFSQLLIDQARDQRLQGFS
jgi:hypothetical protein